MKKLSFKAFVTDMKLDHPSIAQPGRLRITLEMTGAPNPRNFDFESLFPGDGIPVLDVEIKFHPKKHTK